MHRYGYCHFCVLLLVLGIACSPVFGQRAKRAARTGKPTAAARSDSTKPAPDAIDPELAAALKSAPTADQWPNANYARLLDLGDVTVKTDGTVIARYRMTYKLFHSERVRNQLAEVNLPYNASYQTLKVISARTIKKDGTIVAVKPEDMRTQTRFADYLMYSDAQSIGFSMPAVEDDSILDYTYEVVTEPLLMDGEFMARWFFSNYGPVSLSRYVLHVPASRAIRYKIYNSDQLEPSIVTSADKLYKTYTWQLSGLAPIEVEPAMPRMKDVAAWMEVSSLDSWQEIANWFWELEQPQAYPTDAIRATVSQLIAGKATDDEKARAIYDWVANRTRYVGLEFGISAYQPHAAADVHDKQYGDCKDKATLLVTMLSLAGIKSSPVLLYPQDRQPVAERLPTLYAFNHCIVLAVVDGKERWLDATAETSAYGDIPNSDRGVQALVVRDGKGEFKTIPAYLPEENGADQVELIKVKPDGSTETSIETTTRGQLSQSLRATFRSLTPDQKKQVMQKVGQGYWAGTNLMDYKLTDANDKETPFVMKFSLVTSNYARKTGSILLIPVENKLGGQALAHPYVKETRVWPIIEEESSVGRSTTTLTLPEGYEIDDLPTEVNLKSPTREYLRKLEKSADGKTITITRLYRTRPGRIPAADYPKVKKFFDEVIRTSEDLIVLKRSNGK